MNGAPFQSPQMAHSAPNTQPGGSPPHNPMALVRQNQPLTQMNCVSNAPSEWAPTRAADATAASIPKLARPIVEQSRIACGSGESVDAPPTGI